MTTIARLLASGYTMTVSGLYITDEYYRMVEDSERKVFTRMDGMHHLLSGFKAIFSS